MTVHLLDANVLIALTLAEHEHHATASTWAAGVDRVAVCPIVEGALIRFLVRMGESATAAASVLRAVRAMPRCEFWPDSLSYADADLVRVRGHRQVTDAYLAGLAAAHDGVLATFDRGLAQEAPDRIVLVGQSV